MNSEIVPVAYRSSSGGYVPLARNILIADDDPHIRDVIVYALEKAGMTTRVARDGGEALDCFSLHGADLIVLDVAMPEQDGLDVCREIRKTSDVPILFLSSRDEEIDRVVGLEIGGDDYVTKPFSPRELVARINAILKRAQSVGAAGNGGDEPLRVGRLELDPGPHVASFDGVAVDLTATEFSILGVFLRRPGRVMDRDTVMTGAYGPNLHVSDRTIDSHIRHVRAKFEAAGCPNVIETVHGVGYRLGSCA
jgi:two-component system OmpR family response regulator